MFVLGKHNVYGDMCAINMNYVVAIWVSSEKCDVDMGGIGGFQCRRFVLKCRLAEPWKENGSCIENLGEYDSAESANEMLRKLLEGQTVEITRTAQSLRESAKEYFGEYPKSILRY